MIGYESPSYFNRKTETSPPEKQSASRIDTNITPLKKRNIPPSPSRLLRPEEKRKNIYFIV